MLAIEFSFPCGRFHATPWGRHVNEGVPEWPPSPYRLLRALYDAWRRKRPDWAESRVRPILEGLASEPPLFRLPLAGASHTRSFLSENKRDPQAKKLVFDAFVALSPLDSVLIGWPGVTLDPQAASDLEELLCLLNFFGRSESWAKAGVGEAPAEIVWNCKPADGVLSRGGWEVVRVACLVPAEEFSGGGREWLEAITWSTEQMIERRRSEPPALRYVDYLRPARCFDLPPVSRSVQREPRVQGVLYALQSTVRARITETLEVAERVRRKLMGIHARIMGDPARVSSKFSGKDAAGRPLSGHRHAYILPLDRDGDGWLDHLAVCSTEFLDLYERLALDRLESVWQPDGKPDLLLTPVQWGTLAELFPPAALLASATPFVPPRHYRKGRGDFGEWLAAEVRREAANHGLPEPVSVTPLPRLVRRGHSFSWLEFRRNRKDDRQDLGYGFELRFAEPVAGPVALGYGCHFGLGQFVPAG